MDRNVQHIENTNKSFLLLLLYSSLIYSSEPMFDVWLISETSEMNQTQIFAFENLIAYLSREKNK